MTDILKKHKKNDEGDFAVMRSKIRKKILREGLTIFAGLAIINCCLNRHTTQAAIPQPVYPWPCRSAGPSSPKGGATKMAKYETMLITSAALDEEASSALIGKFKSLIEANGTIDSIDEWGKRRLAYPINDEEEGVYTVINFTADPSFPAELDRVYKITEGVMRSLIVAHEE